MNTLRVRAAAGVMLVLLTLGFAPRADAVCPSCVVAIEQLNAQMTATLNAQTGQITAMHVDLARDLQGIGQAINQNGTKVAAQIEAGGNATRSMMVRQRLDQAVQEARKDFTIPGSVCSNSASGGMRQVATSAAAVSADLRRGVTTGTSRAVDQALNSPAIGPQEDNLRTAALHASYCDSVDYAAYGGTKACPALSTQMPGGDKRVDSLLSGAGPNGHAPDLTFTPQQTDAARLYTQNSVFRSLAPQLSKGEAETSAGKEYLGLRTKYQAILNAAAEPQRRAVADRQPDPQTKALLQSALQTPSAKAYFDETASPEAKKLGYVSYAELEQFEVGRRYANTDYEADLQAMRGDNLRREQIRVEALNAYLLLELKHEIHRKAIIEGLMLASLAHQEYGPSLRAMYRQTRSSLGGGQ